MRLLVENVWRDRLKAVTSGEGGPAPFRGSIEEIREVDEEYIYSSEMQSSETTERLLNENPSAFLKPFSLNGSEKKGKTASLESNVLGSEKSPMPVQKARVGTFASLTEIINSVPSLLPNGLENRDPKSNIATPNTKAADDILGTSSKQLFPLTSNCKEKENDENMNEDNRVDTPSGNHQYERMDLPMELRNTCSNPHNHTPEAYSTVQSSVKYLSPINTQLENIRKKHESNNKLFGQGRASPETAKPSSKLSLENHEKPFKKFTSSKELHPGNPRELLTTQHRNSRDQLRNNSGFHSQSSFKHNPHMPFGNHFGSPSYQFAHKGSNDFEANRKQASLKPKTLKTVASPLRPLPSNSELLNLTRKWEDKIVARIGSQSVTFNQLVQNLKKSGLKSPRKLPTTQLKD